MRLLLVSNGFPPVGRGGAETVAYGQARGLADLGHDVHVLTLVRDKSEAQTLKDSTPCLTFHAIHTPNLYHPAQAKDMPGRVKPVWHLVDLWNAVAYRQMAAVLERVSPDLVHTHNLPGLSGAIWQAAARRGIPVVHTVHDYWLLCPRTTLLRRNGEICTDPFLGCRLYREIRRMATRSVGAVIYPLEQAMQLHQTAGFFLQAQSLVLPNFVSLEQGAVRRDLDTIETAGDGVCVLFLGKLDEHKGVRQLLDGFKAFLSRGGQGVLHVGGDGPLRGLIEREAARCPSIQYHGYVGGEEKQRFLVQADVLAVPSTCYEVGPLTVLEAVAMGKPVIAADVMPISSLIRANRLGWVVPARDSDALASTLIQVQQAKARGELCRERDRYIRFAERFSLAKYLQGILTLYNLLLRKCLDGKAAG